MALSLSGFWHSRSLAFFALGLRRRALLRAFVLCLGISCLASGFPAFWPLYLHAALMPSLRFDQFGLVLWNHFSVCAVKFYSSLADLRQNSTATYDDFTFLVFIGLDFDPGSVPTSRGSTSVS
jgi:hypothetical protein